MAMEAIKIDKNSLWDEVSIRKRGLGVKKKIQKKIPQCRWSMILSEGNCPVRMSVLRDGRETDIENHLGSLNILRFPQILRATTSFLTSLLFFHISLIHRY
jgi:hypothetical protein